MPIQRLNHAVLYVRNLERSLAFYQDVLGFRVVNQIGGRAAFIQAAGSTNDHDLGLFEIGASAPDSAAGRTVGLYHLAWEVDTLGELARLAAALRERGALVGASDHSTTKSLYAKDPDGLEFEVAWVVPAALLSSNDVERRSTIAHLDLPGQIERFGADTPGGVGVSVPV